MVVRQARWLGFARRWSALMLICGLFVPAAGCESEEQYYHRLHGPTDAAVLPPGDIFEVPVGYVPNYRTGRIAKLDLKRIDLLVEEQVASWLDAPYLPCGADRVLDQIVVVSDGSTRIEVFVSDNRNDQILRVPHVRPDGEGSFTFIDVLWTVPILLGPDGSELSDGPILDSLVVRQGYATTEDWTLTYHNQSWVVTGTASGIQQQEAIPGLAYETDGEELGFTILHDGVDVEEGTSFVFSTDTGIEAFDVPGVVSDMKVTPDGSLLVASVFSYDGNGGLFVIRPDPLILADDMAWIDLPAGTIPENIGLHADGNAFFVADSSDANRVLLVTFAEGDLDSFVIEEIPVTEPVFDVAHSRDPDFDYLFAAAAYGETVEIIDLDSGDPVDTNVWTEEVDPVLVGSLITGLEATNEPLSVRALTPTGHPGEAYAVVASTYAGYMHVIEADTGCQTWETAYGPYLEYMDLGSTVIYHDVGPTNDTILLADPITAESVSINPCGGIAHDQSWTLRFEEATQDWEVEGVISGIQEGRARENLRYVSDDGEISFVIASGARATSDGDWIQFSINDGVSPVQVLELPADPVIYTDVYDFREGSWWTHKEREIALLPNTGNDVVVWIHVEGYGSGGLKYFR